MNTGVYATPLIHTNQQGTILMDGCWKDDTDTWCCIMCHVSLQCIENSFSVVELFMSDSGINAIVVSVERYEWTVRVRRAGADDAKGRSASWGLGTPGVTQPVRLLPGDLTWCKGNVFSLYAIINIQL